jgi:hypothetical protein
VWHKFTFNENSTGPIYLAYDEDTGFAELTQQQWNDRQSGEPRMWGQSDQNATPRASNSVGENPRTRGSRPLIGGSSASLPPKDAPEYQKENRPK